MRPVNPKRFILFNTPSRNLCPPGYKYLKMKVEPETLQTFLAEGATFLTMSKSDISDLVRKLEAIFGCALSRISYNISVKLPIGLLKPDDQVISISPDNSISLFKVVCR
jgi:hypothetical protein